METEVAGAPEAGAGGAQAGVMSSTTIKINGVEIATDVSKPTVININMNRSSVLASLLSAWKGPESAPEGAKARSQDGVKFQKPAGPKAPARPFGGEQKVLGAIQILLGLVCVSIAVLFCFVGSSNMFYTASGYWTGFPWIGQAGVLVMFDFSAAFEILDLDMRKHRLVSVAGCGVVVFLIPQGQLMVVGLVSVASGKHGNKCWLTIASLFNWAAVGVTIAGIVIIANDFTSSPYRPWDPDYLCDQRRFDGSDSSYDPKPTSWNSNYRLENCKDRLYKLMCLYNGLRIMLLAVTSLALCIALTSLGYGCKSLCCKVTQEDEAISVTSDDEPLIFSQGSNFPEKPKIDAV